MTNTFTVVTCDLCGHVEHPERMQSQEVRRNMHQLKFSGTDQGGHDEEWTKEICDECRKRIKAL